MIPPFLYDWPPRRLAALYNAQLKRRDRFFKHPKAMIALRELVKERNP